MSERAHDILKNWMIEEAKNKVNSKGDPYYKRAYSGDTEPVDVRRRKKRFDYQPDVVLIENNSVYLIEIAFSENWRAIVGELALAKAAEAEGIMFILYGGESGWKKEDIDEILSVVGEAIDYEEWYSVVLTEEEYDDMEKAKKRLRKDMDEWI